MRRWWKYTLCALLCIGAAAPAMAAHAEPAAKGGDLDARELIFSHIADAHEWHVTTWGDTHITIPLPVIVYSRQTGWNVFMSSALHHGGHNGLYISEQGVYKGKLVERNAAGEEVRPIDLSITKNALALMINGLILVCIVMGMVRWYRRNPDRKVPKGFVGAMELFVMDISDNLVKPCAGDQCHRYEPYLLTAFFFILINNVTGLIPFFPGGASTTGNIAVTLVLAVCTLLVVNLFANKEYWREIFWPDVPVWLKVPLPLMPVIELFGIFSKPFALMIRLFANMMAGHAIILSLICLIFITVSMGPAVNAGMSVIGVLLSIFMNFVELLVAYIQAYVFTMLSAIFIGLSQPKAHHKPNVKTVETK